MTTLSDQIDMRTARAVASLFDLPADGLTIGARLPLMWHLFYFLTLTPQAQIGSDGHPTVGEATPPGTRRMFAGGRVRTQPGLRVGDSVTAAHEVAADTTREGRSGTLRFVTHRTTMTVAADLPALIDERDIVYIPLTPASGAPAPSAEADQRRAESDQEADVPAAALLADTHASIVVDPTLLFRFSALTHNAHRIHYDREYARDVEGYPGLVVHGPLQAVLMAGLAETEHGDSGGPMEFSYRLVAPLFEDQGLIVAATRSDNTIVTSVMDRSGRVTATGVLAPVAPSSGSAEDAVRS